MRRSIATSDHSPLTARLIARETSRVRNKSVSASHPAIMRKQSAETVPNIGRDVHGRLRSFLNTDSQCTPFECSGGVSIIQLIGCPCHQGTGSAMMHRSRAVISPRKNRPLVATLSGTRR
jgi:hypothetical protein